MSFLNDNLDHIVELTKGNKNLTLTGEKNLTLTKAELIKKISTYPNSEGYFDVLEHEHMILERQGLIKGEYISGAGIQFNVSDWDRFICSVNAFYISYQEVGETND